MIRVSLVLHTIVPNDAFGAAKTVIKPLETELVKFGPISMFGLKHQTRCQRFRKIYECFGEMLHMRSHGRNTQQFTK